MLLKGQTLLLTVDTVLPGLHLPDKQSKSNLISFRSLLVQFS